MRRRHRSSPPSDSLELLLDTLCNTFGGVLFIAILVVILLQMSSGRVSPPGTPPADADELQELADELELITQEVNFLRNRVLKGHHGDQPATEDRVDFKQQTALLREQLEQLTQRRHNKLNETSRHDAKKAAIDVDLASLTQRSAQAAQDAAMLRLEIAKERKLHARTLRTPIMHRTRKRMLAIELRYGKLYFLHRHSLSGERLGPNLDDYVLLSSRSHELVVTADPTRGVPMASPARLKMALKEKLSRFPPDDWALDLAVRADSFDLFHSLMDAAQELGFEMRPFLTEDDGMFTDRGGTRETVQ